MALCQLIHELETSCSACILNEGALKEAKTSAESLGTRRGTYYSGPLDYRVMYENEVLHHSKNYPFQYLYEDHPPFLSCNA